MSGLPWIPRNFLALSDEQSNLERARVVLMPVPYDSTTSFRSGAREGPGAILEASCSLEDYDHELDLDVSQFGIHTTAALEPHMGGPGPMVDRIRTAVRGYAQLGKLVGVLGGEHSITIGSVQAQRESYPDLSVLYLDAHADLRNQYMDTPWGHASGARRVHEMCPLVLVGVRSLCQEERDYIRAHAIATFFWPLAGDYNSCIRDVVRRLSPSVYVSIDLDVFDPSVMSAVGTPEPGGMGWYEVLSLLHAVAEARRIVGFDVSELCPREGPNACAYTAAKLVYKLMAYAVTLPGVAVRE
jgi:agmatinase